MIKENMIKLVDVFKVKNGENNKRKIENLVVFVVILIITIIMINAIWNDNKDNKSKINQDNGKALAKIDNIEDTVINENTNNTEYNLEDKLKNILTKIDGVGKVDVLITYSESSEIKAMYNEDITKNDTEEKDTSRR